MRYRGHQGNAVGQSDDEIAITAASASDAMRQAMEWASDADWPDGDYIAAVWVVEDQSGDVVAQEDVYVSGTRVVA